MRSIGIAFTRPSRSTLSPLVRKGTVIIATYKHFWRLYLAWVCESLNYLELARCVAALSGRPIDRPKRVVQCFDARKVDMRPKRRDIPLRADFNVLSG